MFTPVFAVLLALSESPSPEPSPSPTPPAQTENRESDAEKRESTPVAQPVVTPTQHGGDAKQKRDNRDDKTSPDDGFKWGMFFTAVGAAVGIVGVTVRIIQVVIARRQLLATQESAAAAVQSAQTQRSSNRADVIVETLVFTDVGDNKGVFYRVRNIGKTSAYIYERLDTVQMIDNPLPDGPPVLEGVPLNKDYFDLATDRNDVTFIGGAFEKSGLDAANFAAKTAEIYAFGVIKYRDNLGTEGTTEYAWQYRRNGPAFLVQQAGYNRRT